ncbi:MAG: DUF3192 domain-containing protein [Nitrosomonadaceae bacterium]
MKNLHLILILVLGAVIAGCDTIETKHLIGQRISEELSDELDGIWDCDGDVLYLNYIKNGELRIAEVDWEEDQFVVEETTAIMTSCGGKHFAHVTDQKDSDDDIRYSFVYYSIIGINKLAIWHPKVRAFEKPIVEEQITGKIQKDEHTTNIIINEPQDSLCEFIKDSRIDNYFYLEGPGVCIRRISMSFDGAQPDKANKPGSPPRSCDCVAFDEVAKKNRTQLNHLKLTMTKHEVINLMGVESVVTGGTPAEITNPQRTEEIKSRNGRVYEVLFYYTQVNSRDGLITDDELTPIVLENGKVIGWGYAFLTGIQQEKRIDINTK